MMLKISLPGKLLPFGEERNIVDNTPTEPPSPENKEPSTNAGLYMVGGIILVMLLMLLFWPSGSHAQDKPTSGLKIGERVPDIAINNIMNYKGPDGKPATSAKISDFKGKLLILDFWATWCSPCVAMIPKMDLLQKGLNEKVDFLSITDENANTVKRFLTRFELQHRQHYQVQYTTDAEALKKLFPHKTLPHYVWINKGKVVAITEDHEVTSQHIQDILSFQSISLQSKRDSILRFDQDKPFLINGNGGDGSQIIYHTVLSKYTEGLGSGFTIYPTDSLKGKRILARNQPISSLFRLAYGKGILPISALVLEVKDTSKLTSSATGMAYRNWLKQGNGFCYELIAPPVMRNQVFEIMQADLARYFSQYRVGFEDRRVKCFVLQNTHANSDKLKTAGGKPSALFDQVGCRLVNQPLNTLIRQLGFKYLQPYGLPIIDRTGYAGKVDMELPVNLSDIKTLNLSLAQYDLRITQSEELTPMLVIKDRVVSNDPLNK
jgi:thiol-disulfide isomerase/thioredoxin